MAFLDGKTCLICAENHGKIVSVKERSDDYVPAHPKCRCLLVNMRTKIAGTATAKYLEGADAYLSNYGRLPDYYITKGAAEDAGWVNWKGNLSDVLPNMMIGGEVYKNKDEKLPSNMGRIWYEADIDYESGYRNDSRILYSNDGLIFVSYDHYKTFYEITK